MVVKMFISGLSASKEIKKHQQRAQMLLDSLKINYETIDITEPGHEVEKELMRNVCKKRNNNTIALPPQFFNEDRYCGDYEDLSLASDDDTVLCFLGLEEDITIENGDASDRGMTNVNDNDLYLTRDDSNNVPNGHEWHHKSDAIDGEVMSEVTTVEEMLTLDGKVIDIPIDKLLELKGETIDLNLLMSQTKPIDERHSVVQQNSQSIDDIHNEEEDHSVTNEEEVKESIESEEMNDISNENESDVESDGSDDNEDNDN